MWYIIFPYKNGYIGKSGSREVFGITRSQVIELLVK